MKYKKLVIEGLNGSQKKKTIPFNSDLTILIGANGTGKTTILRMLNALLTLNIDELADIKFKKSTLSLDINGEMKDIKCTKDELGIKVSISGIVQTLAINHGRYKYNDDDFDHSEAEFKNDFYRALIEEDSTNAIIDFYKNVVYPQYLGITRAQSVSLKYLLHRLNEQIVRKNRFAGRRAASLTPPGPLSMIQRNIQNKFRDIREKQDLMINKFKTDLLRSFFRIDNIGALTAIKTVEDLKKLRNMQVSIQKAVLNLFNKDEYENERKEIVEYFSSLDSTYSKINLDNGDIRANSFQYSLNCAQLKKIESLSKTLMQHQKELENTIEPITRFENIIDQYFGESNKRIKIDAVGSIRVFKDDEHIGGESILSSGERQILLIFGNLLFPSFPTIQKGIIIDEPELSMHLTWQDSLLESLKIASAGGQITVATHSPEIIANFESSVVEL